MEENRTKKIVLNTLLLIFCCVIIALFCLTPDKIVHLEKYKVNFDSDGGTAIVALEVEDGGTIQKPEDPTKEGYEFVGWMLGDEVYDFTNKVNKDITLKASWQEVKPDVVYYTVTFDSGGGTPQGNQVIEAGKAAVKPVPDPVKENFTFDGWMLNGALFDFATPINSDITLVAGWTEVEPEPEPEPDVVTYTVTFNTNGGSKIASQKVKEGETATKPKNPTRSGYTFKGWYTTSSGSTTFNFNTKITKNTTVYAQWNKNSSSGGGGSSGGSGGGNSGHSSGYDNIVNYKVIFHSNYPNGSNAAAKTYSMTVPSNNNVITTSRPSLSTTGFSTPKYFSFKGWNDSASATTGKNISVAKDNKAIYAIWEPKSFTVNCYISSDDDDECTLVVSYGNSVDNSAIIKFSGVSRIKRNCDFVSVNGYKKSTAKATINGYDVEFPVTKNSIKKEAVSACG